MPRLQDGQEALLQAQEDTRNWASQEFETFSDFALRDGVLEVAVGLILAAAFKSLVDTFVDSILLPPISLLPFLDRNLDEMFAVLRGGGASRLRNDYNTTEQAVADGAVIMAYGRFINRILNFMGIAISLYLIARLYSRYSRDNIIKKQIKCQFCRKWISEKAKRCVNCTSWQDGREQ